jgi:hypothetical protein
MKENGIYDPPGFSLPALKIKKRKSRKNIENDSSVNNLIESKLLLNREFNFLYLNIFNKSNKIYNLFKNPIRYGKESFFENLLSIDIKEDKMSNIFMDTLKDWEAFRNKTYHFNSKATEDIIFRFNKNINIENKAKLIELSKKIQDDLFNFEESRKIDLSILSATTVYFCRNCNQIISLNKFKRTKCSCGEDINNISKVDQIPIHHFNNNIINFLGSNYWFEHGVDYILRKKNLQTIVGYDVLGNSGVWHEIDNIVYCKNENYRFFCECKNSEVNEKDIFIFSGKMIDIGGISGYIFTTTENVPKEINRLARSKNIKIIKEVLRKDVKTLINEIKEG